MTFYVYHIHVMPSLDLGYIGVTKNPQLRWQQHGWARKQSNRHLRSALKKYGDAVKFTMLASNLDQEAAELLEQMLRPRPNMGWNIAVGGGIPPNPQGKIRSEQYRSNIAKAKMGASNPMFGKKLIFSDAHRKNLSTALKGRSSALKGKKRPQLQCPHCGRIGGAGGMYTHHFDHCKAKNENI